MSLRHLPSETGAQIVVLTPYLAQLVELRDALDGTISDQDASNLAVVINQGGEGGGGHRSENQGKYGPGIGSNTTESRAFGPDPRPKVRVSTGELSKFSLVCRHLRCLGARVLPCVRCPRHSFSSWRQHKKNRSRCMPTPPPLFGCEICA